MDSEIGVHGKGVGNYLVDVAKCEVTQRVVSVYCELADTGNFQPVPVRLWFHEFSFHIYIRSVDGSELSIFTQDRDIARNYIPNVVIPLIIKIVIQSCGALIKEVIPKVPRPDSRGISSRHFL